MRVQELPFTRWRDDDCGTYNKEPRKEIAGELLVRHLFSSEWTTVAAAYDVQVYLYINIVHKGDTHHMSTVLFLTFQS